MENKAAGRAMTDSHVHIGQYEDRYYDPFEIMDVVMSAGMEGMSFSTTSRCKKNILYPEIEKEIVSFLSRISYNAETIRPFLWYIPDYINQNIAIESAFGSIPYKGIKLHPFAHNWDFNNMRHMEVLHSLFDYAAGNNLPVLIHTGHSGIDSADRFERFMDEYRSVKCILAHCRPIHTTIEMLKKYSNVYCDTAFTPKTDIRQIDLAGLQNKIIFGSDFPITHFFRIKYPGPGENPAISLREKYAEDTADWKKWKIKMM
jgi:predicted TIM-barrel fold metal-dependent hydrolase